MFSSPETEEERRRRLQEEQRKVDEANAADAPRSKLGQALVGVPILGALLGKGKYLLVGAKLFKFKSLASLLLSVGAYSMIFGLPFAAGFMGMVVIHEAGHALVMAQRGLPVGPMTFIPFLGASVELEKHPQDAYDEALIAFGGPVVGGLAAVACAGLASSMDSQLLFAVAEAGFMINMFNLLPIGSMDGGRIAGAMSKHFSAAGVAIGAAAAYALPIYNPIVYLVLLTGAYSTWQRYSSEEEKRGYYDIPFEKKMGIGAGYIALIAALVAAWQWNKRRLMPASYLKKQKEMEQAASERGVTLPVRAQEAPIYINNQRDPFEDRSFDEDFGLSYFDGDGQDQRRYR